MTPVEQLLRAAGANAGWPETPDLAAAVVTRIEGLSSRQTGDTRIEGLSARQTGDIAADAPAVERRRRAIRPGFGIRRPLLVAIAALLVLAATAAAIPGIRDPVLDWLGLRSVHVERVPAPLPAPRGQRLGLGERTALAAARRRLGFTPVLLAGLGRPTVYYDGFPPGGQLGLVYPGGVFVTEVEGRVQTQYLFKFLGPSAKADRVTINGERALWIHGQPHQYAYADRTGEIRTGTIRTAGNTLLWRRGPLLLRLEGVQAKARAIAIARAARPTP